MHMIDLRLRPEKLIAHAQDQGHNRSRDEDLGYAVHSWLRATLGKHSPTSFRLIDTREGSLRLLGYGPSDAQTLCEHATTFADPSAANACDWNTAASKDMGSIRWRVGQRLGFECRLCPVVRGKSGERDAFLAALPEGKEPADTTRSEIYHSWTADRLHPAVELEDTSFKLKAFRLVSTWRQGAAGQGGRRRGRRVSFARMPWSPADSRYATPIPSPPWWRGALADTEPSASECCCFDRHERGRFPTRAPRPFRCPYSSRGSSWLAVADTRTAVRRGWHAAFHGSRVRRPGRR